MTAINKPLYDAMISCGVPVDKATAAARSVTDKHAPPPVPLTHQQQIANKARNKWYFLAEDTDSIIESLELISKRILKVLFFLVILMIGLVVKSVL